VYTTKSIPVLARSDGPFFASIVEAVHLANDLQTYFRFTIESPGWLPKESVRARPLADKAFRSQMSTHDPRTPLIVITSIALWGGNFAFEYRDRSVISVHDWEENFAPPPVKVYLVYQLAYIATIIAGNLPESQFEKMQHRPKGCLFDESYGPDEFRVGLVGAHLCAACEGRLSEMMIPDDALESVNQLLSYVRGATIRRVRVPGTSIFIGHGRAEDWKDLDKFLSDKLRCNVVEFNSEATAGIYTGQRILDMLDLSTFAFLVMTAEDEQADGTVNARQNVIHEIGLCQGRLGFKRAVMLKEDRTAEFSNLNGLTHIAFRKGAMAAAFPEVVRTLVREGLVDPVLAGEALRTRPGAV
jgi:hypothetical protein